MRVRPPLHTLMYFFILGLHTAYGLNEDKNVMHHDPWKRYFCVCWISFNTLAPRWSRFFFRIGCF